jgi:hypothetical protein
MTEVDQVLLVASYTRLFVSASPARVVLGLRREKKVPALLEAVAVHDTREHSTPLLDAHTKGIECTPPC